MIKNELKPTELKTADFHYDLPEELIAQHPSEKRDEARLMVLDREKQTVEHRIFRDITEYLHEGDVLVINDSKVIPARIYGEKINENGGEGAKAEFVLLRQKISIHGKLSCARADACARECAFPSAGESLSRISMRLSMTETA